MCKRFCEQTKKQNMHVKRFCDSLRVGNDAQARLILQALLNRTYITMGMRRIIHSITYINMIDI